MNWTLHQTMSDLCESGLRAGRRWLCVVRHGHQPVRTAAGTCLYLANPDSPLHSLRQLSTWPFVTARRRRNPSRFPFRQGNGLARTQLPAVHRDRGLFARRHRAHLTQTWYSISRRRPGTVKKRWREPTRLRGRRLGHPHGAGISESMLWELTDQDLRLPWHGNGRRRPEWPIKSVVRAGHPAVLASSREKFAPGVLQSGNSLHQAWSIRWKPSGLPGGDESPRCTHAGGNRSQKTSRGKRRPVARMYYRRLPAWRSATHFRKAGNHSLGAGAGATQLLTILKDARFGSRASDGNSVQPRARSRRSTTFNFVRERAKFRLPANRSQLLALFPARSGVLLASVGWSAPPSQPRCWLTFPSFPYPQTASTSS